MNNDPSHPYYIPFMMTPNMNVKLLKGKLHRELRHSEPAMKNDVYEDEEVCLNKRVGLTYNEFAERYKCVPMPLYRQLPDEEQPKDVM